MTIETLKAASQEAAIDLKSLRSPQTKPSVSVEGHEALNVEDMTYLEAQSIKEEQTADSGQPAEGIDSGPRSPSTKPASATDHQVTPRGYPFSNRVLPPEPVLKPLQPDPEWLEKCECGHEKRWHCFEEAQFKGKCEHIGLKNGVYRVDCRCSGFRGAK